MRALLIGIFFVLQIFSFVPSAKSQDLTISTVERHPFVIQSKGQLTGFSIDLFNAIAFQMGREVKYVLSENGFPGMLDSVRNMEVDGAIANISITSSRENDMDFSQPIYDAGLRIMVPKTKGSAGLSSVGRAIWNSGLLQILIVAMGVLVVVAHVMWLLERKGNTFIRDKYIPGIWDAFWWSLVLVTMGGFEDQQPRKKVAKVFAVFWIIASLFVTSLFIAKITSSFTIQQLHSDIKSYTDLAGNIVGVTKNSTAEKFLREQGIQTVGYEDISTLFDDVRNGKLDAVVHDQPLVRYYAARSGKGRVQLVGTIFKKEKYGIALQTKSSIMEEINRTLLHLHENGTYASLQRKWFGD